MQILDLYGKQVTQAVQAAAHLKLLKTAYTAAYELEQLQLQSHDLYTSPV